MNNLTIKQERFILEYMKDGNASRAYRESYNAKNMGEATINVHSCNLLKKDKIALRVKELRNKETTIAIISIEKRKELLTKFAYEEDSTNAMKAIDLLNKMDSAYTIKQEIEHKGNIQLFIPAQDDNL